MLYIFKVILLPFLYHGGYYNYKYDRWNCLSEEEKNKRQKYLNNTFEYKK